MSGSIPFAQPYPWESPSVTAAQKTAAQSLRKRKFVGSGMAYLRDDSLGPNSKMGRKAQNILNNLFHQHGIDPPAASGVRKGESSQQRSKRSASSVPSKLQVRGELQPGISDVEMLRRANAGEFSLFKTILRVIEKEEGVVHTREFLSKTCLLVQPSTMPGQMDSRDFVLSALHFLSTTFVPKSPQLLELPMIQAVQVYSDLEKRSYKKAGKWKLDEIECKVLNMEELFLASSASWKWLKRERFCPRLKTEEEALFFQKGTVPDGAEPKRKGEARRRPRKTASASTSPTPSAMRSETPTPSFLAEASVDGTATSIDNDDEDDDDGPVVEATILEDDDDVEDL